MKSNGTTEGRLFGFSLQSVRLCGEVLVLLFLLEVTVENVVGPVVGPRFPLC